MSSKAPLTDDELTKDMFANFDFRTPIYLINNGMEKSPVYTFTWLTLIEYVEDIETIEEDLVEVLLRLVNKGSMIWIQKVYEQEGEYNFYHASIMFSKQDQLWSMDAENTTPYKVVENEVFTEKFMRRI